MDTETKNKIIALENEVRDLKTKLNSIFSLSNFPNELENILIQRGFQNVGESELQVTHEGGVGGNTFLNKYRQTKFRNKVEYYTYPDGVKQFTVNTTTNVCYCPNNGFIDGRYFLFETTGTLPAGLDSTIDTYWVINATQDTFQVTTDGVNPVDITSIGTGDQYASTY